MTVCCVSRYHSKQGGDQSIFQSLTSYLQVHTPFSVIFSDLWLANLDIISANVNNNLNEFTFRISQHF